MYEKERTLKVLLKFVLTKICPTTRFHYHTVVSESECKDDSKFWSLYSSIFSYEHCSHLHVMLYAIHYIFEKKKVIPYLSIPLYRSHLSGSQEELTSTIVMSLKMVVVGSR